MSSSRGIAETRAKITQQKNQMQSKATQSHLFEGLILRCCPFGKRKGVLKGVGLRGFEKKKLSIYLNLGHKV